MASNPSAKHGVPIWCSGLAPCPCRASYDDAKLNADIAGHLQETAVRGVLVRRGGLLFITYMHKAEDIDQTLAAMDEALAVVADAVAKGDLAQRLRVKKIEESFRRF